MSTSVTGAGRVPVTVLIPTKDEELNLPTTLDALTWADQVIVFDSCSTDHTVEIAKERNCEVAQRIFDNYSDHKNWALDHLQFRNDWILILDADEKVPPDLAAEIAAIVVSPSACDGYFVARQIIVDGHWLRRAGKYPDYQLRFFRKGRARYERRIVHEHMVVEGRVGHLKHHLTHVDAKGTFRYIDRHNRFAEMEAVEAFITMRTGADSIGVAPDHGQQWLAQRSLKAFAYRWLPFRPLLVLIYLYFFKLGFMMGRAGLKTCVLRMYYEYMVDLYLAELRDPTSPISVKYRDYLAERLRRHPS